MEEIGLLGPLAPSGRGGHEISAMLPCAGRGLGVREETRSARVFTRDKDFVT